MAQSRDIVQAAHNAKKVNKLAANYGLVNLVGSGFYDAVDRLSQPAQINVRRFEVDGFKGFGVEAVGGGLASGYLGMKEWTLVVAPV